MHFLTYTTLFATLSAIQVAAQGVVVSSPAAGTSFAAGSVTITVTDSGDAPTLATLKTGTVDLVWGGNTAANSKSVNGLGTFAYPATTLTVTINPGAGPPITSGYYFRITSNSADGGSVINYSGRYTITGMTAAADPALTSAAQAAAGAAPAPVVQAAAAGAAGAAAAAGGLFDVPYAQQTGLTKYAPMQPVPPTRITKKDYTPLYPTSAFNIAVTFMPRPSIVLTTTQAQTFSVSSVENQAAPQSNPNTAMQKFLNRWKD